MYFFTNKIVKCLGCSNRGMVKQYAKSMYPK